MHIETRTHINTLGNSSAGARRRTRENFSISQQAAPAREREHVVKEEPPPSCTGTISNRE